MCCLAISPAADVISELLRVVSQLAQTRDFYGVEDAHELWSVLPEQFNVFKIGKDH